LSRSTTDWEGFPGGLARKPDGCRGPLRTFTARPDQSPLRNLYRSLTASQNYDHLAQKPLALSLDSHKY
jgi:hypothetical protein